MNLNKRQNGNKNRLNFKNTIGHALIVCSMMVMTLPSHAQSLPDEADYEKHNLAYQAAKQQSDSLRAHANQAQAFLSALQSKIDTAELNIRNVENKINDNNRLSEDLRNEIPRLESEITNINRNIDQYRSDVKRYEDTHRKISQELDELDNYVSRLDRDRRPLEDRLRILGPELDRRQRDFEIARDLWERERVELENMKRSLDENRTRLINLKAKIPDLKKDLADSQRKKETLENQLRTVDQDITNAQAKVTAEEAKLAPLRQAIQTAKQSETNAQNELNAAKPEYDKVAGRINQAQKDVDAANKAVQDTKTQINNLGSQKTTKSAEIATQQSKVTQIEQDLANWDAGSAALVTEVANLQAKWDANQNEMKAILARNPGAPRVWKDPNDQKRYMDITRENAPLQRELQIKQNALAARNAGKTQKQTELSQAKTTLDNLKADLPKLDQQIALAKTQLSTNESALATAQANKTKVDQEAGAAKTRYDNANASLTQAKAAVAQAETTLSNQSKELEKAKADLATVTRRKTEGAKELKEVTERVTLLTKRIPDLETEVLATEKDIDQLANFRIPKQQQQTTRARQEKEQSENNLIIISDKYNAVRAELKNLDDAVARAQNDIRNREAELSRVNKDIDNIYVTIRSEENNILSKRNRILQNQTQIASIENDNKNLSNQLPGLDKILADLEKQEPALQSDFNIKDQAARTAESTTDEKLAKANDSRSRYDQLISEARSKGFTIGVQKAGPDVKNQGETDGGAAGTSEGTQKGKDDGLLYGFEFGKSEGLKNGKTEGYNKGLASETDYNAGFASGRIQGQKDALAEATSTDYPKGKSEKLTELMNRVPSREVTLSNNVSAAANAVFKTMSSFFGITSLSNADDESGTTETIVSNTDLNPNGEFSVSYLNLLADSEAICKEIAKNKNVFKDVKAPAYECELPYTATRAACRSAYEQAYREEFGRLYGSIYKGALVSACTVAYDNNFDANKNVRYEEGYRPNYNKEFGYWQTEGAKKANSNGMLAGKTKGYDETIVDARATEAQRGRNEVIERFNKTAVGTLYDAQLEKTSEGLQTVIVAGDKLSLKLKLANLGKVDSQKGEFKVKVSALTGNISTSAGSAWMDIVTLPAESVVNLVDVADVMVLQTAPASYEQVEVQVLMPDGQIRTQRLQIQVNEHVRVVTHDISAELNPRIKRGQDVKLYFKNISSVQPKEDFDVRISSPNTPSHWIKFTKPSTTLDKDDLKPGRELSLSNRLSYEILSEEAVGKRIDLEFKGLYRGNVAFQMTLTIVPKLK